MNEILIEEKISDLPAFGNVIPDGYKYYKKKIVPGSLLKLPAAYLKWYNLYPEDAEIAGTQVIDAKAFLKSESEARRLKLENELGFVIHHRAGDYLLLLITTWRNTNEMWESVYVKKVNETESFIPIKFNTDHKGTYCVWELGIVWHERNAWVNFIESGRDEKAKLIYLNDLFTGVI
jgi:hypothetical protein